MCRNDSGKESIHCRKDRRTRRKRESFGERQENKQRKGGQNLWRERQRSKKKEGKQSHTPNDLKRCNGRPQKDTVCSGGLVRIVGKALSWGEKEGVSWSETSDKGEREKTVGEGCVCVSRDVGVIRGTNHAQKGGLAAPREGCGREFERQQVVLPHTWRRFRDALSGLRGHERELGKGSRRKHVSTLIREWAAAEVDELCKMHATERIGRE